MHSKAVLSILEDEDRRFLDFMKKICCDADGPDKVCSKCGTKRQETCPMFDVESVMEE